MFGLWTLAGPGGMGKEEATSWAHVTTWKDHPWKTAKQLCISPPGGSRWNVGDSQSCGEKAEKGQTQHRVSCRNESEKSKATKNKPLPAPL